MAHKNWFKTLIYKSVHFVGYIT